MVISRSMLPRERGRGEAFVVAGYAPGLPEQ